jgi:hypothetical protein
MGSSPCRVVLHRPRERQVGNPRLSHARTNNRTSCGEHLQEDVRSQSDSLAPPLGRLSTGYLPRLCDNAANDRRLMACARPESLVSVTRDAEAQMLTNPVEPADVRPRPADDSTNRWVDFGRRGRDDPFVMLPAEQTPPDGIQAAEGLWGLVTVDGEPVAFVSPEVVSGLNPYRPVGSLFDNLERGYVARFAREPRRFFEAELAYPVVSGRVIVLDDDFAQSFGQQVTLIDFAATRCMYGEILQVGRKCNRCRCQRATA